MTVYLRLILLATGAVTTPALAQIDSSTIAEALRRKFTEKQQVREVIEGNADVRKRFEKWLGTMAKKQLQSLSANPPKDPALRKELLERVEKEQQLRKLAIARKKVDSELEAVDRENRTWLASLVDERGWPGKTLVGVDGAHAAWLLVQHADSDRPFQKCCLRLMQETRDGEVSSKDIAYLVDRVRVGEGSPQLYGTQLMTVGCRMVLKDVEDPANLDSRREQAEMMPIEIYLLFAGDTYKHRQ